ncbi:putative Modular polyketide synthase [Actinacidiphila cocklensis]|uniref:Modular polyketide synthase n=1 Tax=Actinacidiphila cocklensis TaxID=887465 RepID=A0A9W4GV30_9ACTN|nr:putative Modular polyketide synthase [Actinacidiphila cocklensis]
MIRIVLSRGRAMQLRGADGRLSGGRPRFGRNRGRVLDAGRVNGGRPGCRVEPWRPRLERRALPGRRTRVRPGDGLRRGSDPRAEKPPRRRRRTRSDTRRTRRGRRRRQHPGPRAGARRRAPQGWPAAAAQPQAQGAALGGDRGRGRRAGHGGGGVRLLRVPGREDPQGGAGQRQDDRRQAEGQRQRHLGNEHHDPRLGQPDQCGRPETRRRRRQRGSPGRRDHDRPPVGGPQQHVGGQHPARHPGGHSRVRGPEDPPRLPQGQHDHQRVAGPRRPGLHAGDRAEPDERLHRPLADDRLLRRGEDGGRAGRRAGVRRAQRLGPPDQVHQARRVRAEAPQGQERHQGQAGAAVAAHPRRVRRRLGPREGPAHVHELADPHPAQPEPVHQPLAAEQDRHHGDGRLRGLLGDRHPEEALRPRHGAEERLAVPDDDAHHAARRGPAGQERALHTGRRRRHGVVAAAQRRGDGRERQGEAHGHGERVTQAERSLGSARRGPRDDPGHRGQRHSGDVRQGGRGAPCRGHRDGAEDRGLHQGRAGPDRCAQPGHHRGLSGGLRRAGQVRRDLGGQGAEDPGQQREAVRHREGRHPDGRRGLEGRHRLQHDAAQAGRCAQERRQPQRRRHHGLHAHPADLPLGGLTGPRDVRERGPPGNPGGPLSPAVTRRRKPTAGP